MPRPCSRRRGRDRRGYRRCPWWPDRASARDRRPRCGSTRRPHRCCGCRGAGPPCRRAVGREADGRAARGAVGRDVRGAARRGSAGHDALPEAVRVEVGARVVDGDEIAGRSSHTSRSNVASPAAGDHESHDAVRESDSCRRRPAPSKLFVTRLWQSARPRPAGSCRSRAAPMTSGVAHTGSAGLDRRDERHPEGRGPSRAPGPARRPSAARAGDAEHDRARRRPAVLVHQLLDHRGEVGCPLGDAGPVRRPRGPAPRDRRDGGSSAR